MNVARHVVRRLRVPGGVGAQLRPPSAEERRRYRRKAAQAAREVERQGFACVPDLFSPTDLAEVEALLSGLFDRFADLSAAGSTYRDWAFDTVEAVRGDGGDGGGNDGRVQQPEILNATSIEPRLRETALFGKLCEFAAGFGFNRLCFDHAMLKPPHGTARTPWHQDAQYVDRRYRGRAVLHPGFRFWIPFHDATIENGCMEYVPGSHRDGLVAHRRYHRGGPRPGWEAEPAAAAVACPVPAGGVAIHTPLTLHGAGANSSARPRLAWIVNFDRIGLMQAARQGLLTRLRR